MVSTKRKPRLKKGTPYIVDFFGYDETGVARGKGPCGYEIRARGVCKGERALVKLDHISPHRPLAWGRIEHIESSISSERVRPPCRRTTLCGGCPWMHLSYDAQLGEKRQRLKKVLASMDQAAIKRGLYIEVESSNPTFHYRNRGKYVLAHKRNQVLMGGYMPRSHRVVSTLGCPVVEKPIDSVARIVAKHLVPLGKSIIYDEKTRDGLLRYLGVRANYRGETLVTLVAANKDDKRLQRLGADLLKRCPELIGVTLDINDTRGNVLFSGRSVRLKGQEMLRERFGPSDIFLKGESFAQTNRHMAEALYDFASREIVRRTGNHNHSTASQSKGTKISESKKPSKHVVWDFFCGAGAFSFHLAHLGFKVLGIELDGSSVELARDSASAQAWNEQPIFFKGDANTSVSKAKDYMPYPDMVVLNPPRAGCRSGLLEDLAGHSIPGILYISCNPETLTRDIKYLVDHGYMLTTLRGFDMLPHTSHIESVAVMEKRKH